MNAVPMGERLQIGIFGQRNAGKSSVMNRITGQAAAVVSKVPGTTTDPVSKAMELPPLGPVVVIDTPGLDDDGELGHKRIERSRSILNKIDLAVLVMDAARPPAPEDEELLACFCERDIPFVIAANKSDLGLADASQKELGCRYDGRYYPVSAKTGAGIDRLKEGLALLRKKPVKKYPLAADLIDPGDLVLLVIPIDQSAPKGRLILPQQQTIRDILDRGGMALTVRDEELLTAMAAFGDKVSLVITDSQIFSDVVRAIPKELPLTSFSILFARYKGNLDQLEQGARFIKELQDGDQILISEGCSHHRQCGDIGTEKLPAWIQKATGRKLTFSFTQGMDFKKDLSPYRLVVHCGGCMLNEREMKYRLGCGAKQGVQVTNYGMVIAYLNGILDRSLKPLQRRDRK